MKEKYNKKILNVYKISFNIKCEMLFLVTNLKNNKNKHKKKNNKNKRTEKSDNIKAG